MTLSHHRALVLFVFYKLRASFVRHTFVLFCLPSKYIATDFSYLIVLQQWLCFFVLIKNLKIRLNLANSVKKFIYHAAILNTNQFPLKDI